MPNEEPKRTDSARVPLSRIKYLAFEGGGGKGIAYLGAVKYLEEKGLLPLSPAKISGVSGASAGAITAFLLALGYTHNRDDKTSLLSLLTGGFDFNRFFENPSTGCFRTVVRKKGAPDKGWPDVEIQVKGRPTPLDAKLNKLDAKYDELLGKVGKLLRLTRDPLAVKLLSALDGYLDTLLNDKGLFSGFAVQEFLGNELRKWSTRHQKAKFYFGTKDISQITFGQLLNLTGIDLRITGTNLATQRGSVFSAKACPNFPVAAAVGISMSIPIAFKPFVVSDFGQGHAPELRGGYWVDGGVTNNLPIHAFDAADPADASASVLNRDIVGFRLIEGDPPIPIVSETVDKLASTRADIILPNGISILSYLDWLLGTLLYPGSEGQVRTASEESQILSLYSGSVSVMQFTASDNTIKNVSAAAYATTKDYFEKI